MDSGPVLLQLAALLRGDARATTPSTAAEWDALLGVADRHLLLPALWIAMRDAGRVQPLPESAMAEIDMHLAGRDAPELMLQRAYQANVSRQAELLEVGLGVLDAIERAGIPVVPLKGLHTLCIGLWHEPGARTMVDVDVLVTPGNGRDAYQALHAVGLSPAPEGQGEFADHQLPSLQTAGGVQVEIHEHLVRRRWDQLLHAVEVLDAARAVDGPVGRRLVMIDTHAMVTLVAHAQLQDETYARFDVPLRALVETQRWVRARPDGVDWDEIRHRYDAVRERHVLDAHVLAADRLLHTKLAAAVGRPRARAVLHDRLTRAGARLPAAKRAVNYFHDLPRSFRRDRMTAAYGPPSGRAWLARARLHHVRLRLRARLRRS